MKYVIIGGVIILGIFLYVLSTIPIGIEPLTELYFNNHTTLPKTVEPNKIYKFSFTINNLEYQNITYNYKITKEYGNISMTLKENNITLENNQSVSITEYFWVQENEPRTKISVTIKNNQSIHFYVEN